MTITESAAPMVSVGVVVHNEAHQIESCLRCLLESAPSFWPLQIIVVDNNSTDETADLARAILKDHPCAVVHVRSFNHMAEARNDALRLAQTPHLAFVDADCRVSVEWLNGLLPVLEKAPAHWAGIGAGNLPPAGHRFRRGWEMLTAGKWLHTGSLQARASRQIQPRAVSHLSTTHALYRCAALRSVGGFDARFRTGGEDLDLSYCLLEKGYVLQTVAVPPMEHHLPVRWSAWLRKIWKYGFSQWGVLRRHPWGIDRRRRMALVGVLVVAIALVARPGLWSWLTAAQLIWLSLEIRPHRSSLRGEISAVIWAAITQQVYALASVLGFFRTAFARK